MNYARENFYRELLENISEKNEIFGFLKKTGTESEFFDLCKYYVDIALNAPRSVKDGTDELVGCFQYDDIEKAQIATAEYCTKNKLNDYDVLLDVIEKYYHMAIEDDDRREKGGLVRNPKSHYQGYIGQYYDFTTIPEEIWSTIKKETIQFLRDRFVQKEGN